MSLGSATAFMITGPATKITNLGALKIAMGWKRFLLYIAFVMLFALVSGSIPYKSIIRVMRFCPGTWK